MTPMWVDIAVFKLTYLHSIVVCIFGHIFSRVISQNIKYNAWRIQLPIPKPQILSFHEYLSQSDCVWRKIEFEQLLFNVF